MSLAFSSDMESVCNEQQHKFHPSYQLYLHKKSLRGIDIPPRKLLSRHHTTNADMFMDSIKAEETLLQNYHPYNDVENDDGDNNGDDDGDGDDDPYSSDHFRMYEFKVRKCTRSRSHDWTDCPFAHPGEKARRRDPRRYHYSGTVCPEFRRGSCSRGDNCEFAHGVFECWLHPSRYRTEACKDGKNCNRKICFFAHTPRQLRILPVNGGDHHENGSSPSGSSAQSKSSRPLHHCCVYCHHHSTTSPTSTLMGMSHFSPPLSPSPHSPPGMKFSPFSRLRSAGTMSYEEDARLAELINSIDAMNINNEKASNNVNSRWFDVNNLMVDDQQQQQQFVLSPSTPSSAAGSSRRSLFANKSFLEDNNGGLVGPDLGWVNDLLT